MSKQSKRGRGKGLREGSQGSPLGPRIQSPIGNPIASNLASSDGQHGGSISSGSLQRGLIAETGGSGHGQKMAIPALKTSSGFDSQGRHKKGRTKHACDSCRQAKSGCTGDQPCKRCKETDHVCVYGDGKRDKDRKRLKNLSDDAMILKRHKYDIHEALEQLRSRLERTMAFDKTRDEIDKVLAMTHADLSNDAEETILVTSPPTNESSSDEDEDDDNALLSPEMTDRGGRKATSNPIMSSGAWVVRPELKSQGRTKQAIGEQDFSRTMTLPSYHTEDSDVDFCDTSTVATFSVPEDTHADDLLKSYFENVHPALPLLNQQQFIERYHAIGKTTNNISQNNHSQEDLIFLGTMNMVFAISSVYSTLTGIGDGFPRDNHMFFLARAKKLCLDTGGASGILFENARVDTTCALGLHCLYFIATSSLNKAVNFCGMAMCHAISLNLHLRNDDIPSGESEYRTRLWWSLYSLECLLNGLKGRPSCIADRDISIPTPMTAEAGTVYPAYNIFDSTDDTMKSASTIAQSGRSSRVQSLVDLQMAQAMTQPSDFSTTKMVPSPTYFLSRIQLCKISHKMYTRLYCAAAGKIPWTKVQRRIDRIEDHRQQWLKSLPQELAIGFNIGNDPDWTDSSVRRGMGLAIEDCYLRIVLFRPCLCRFEARFKSLVDQRNQGMQSNQDFDQETVISCVKAATDMILLLSTPEQSGRTLYAYTPWWSVLHYLCEALSVLLLEMAFQARHAPLHPSYTLEPVKTGIKWLNVMSEHSVSARKAWEMYDRLIRHIATRVSANWNIFELPTSSPVPPSYRSSAPGLLQPGHSDVFQHHDSGVEAWQHSQHAQHGQHHGFEFEDFGPSFDSDPSRTEVLNQLTTKDALSRFAAQVTLHGQYDDNTWKELFRVKTGDQQMGGMESSGRGEASGLRTTLPMPFEANLAQFDPMEGIEEDFDA